MSRGPYDPPATPVESPVVERAPARWRWLWVPVGHAVLTFFFMTTWWWLEPRPAEAPPANFLLEADSIWWIAKEAIFQGGVLLVPTGLLLWALPRILVRHVVYVAWSSGVSRWLVDLAAIYVSGPVTNNGERLDRTVVTYGVVLLLSSVVIRRAGSMSPNTSLERTRGR